MSLSQIKPEYKTTVVAFGNSGLPLGDRDDIDQLAIIAQESKDPTLLKFFEVLPPLHLLKKTKVDQELKEVVVPKKVDTEESETE